MLAVGCAGVVVVGTGALHNIGNGLGMFAVQRDSVHIVTLQCII
jgi:hypothetical protein